MGTNLKKFFLIVGIGLFGLILFMNFQGVKLFEGTYASTDTVEKNDGNGSNRDPFEIHVHATKPERLEYLEFSSETFFEENVEKDEEKEKEEEDKKVIENDNSGEDKVDEKKKEDIVEPEKKTVIKKDEKTAQEQSTDKKDSDENETNQKEEKVEESKTPSLTYELNEYEQEVVRLTNLERKKQGLSQLQVDRSLSYVAKKKSEDMVNNKYFSHTSPVYGSFFDLLEHFGIDYSYAGENLAYGFSTPEKVVTAWMNSEGHRKNILNPKYTHIGIGYVSTGHYWTMHLIRK